MKQLPVWKLLKEDKAYSVIKQCAGYCKLQPGTKNEPQEGSESCGQGFFEGLLVYYKLCYKCANERTHYYPYWRKEYHSCNKSCY